MTSLAEVQWLLFERPRLEAEFQKHSSEQLFQAIIANEQREAELLADALVRQLKPALAHSVPALDQGEPSPVPQGEPHRPESGAAAKQAALESLLVEIDKRAIKQDAGFDRHSLPGTKIEFARLLQAHCPIFRHVGALTVAAYLKGKCQFQRGVRPEQGKGAEVWALFPEYDFK